MVPTVKMACPIRLCTIELLSSKISPKTVPYRGKWSAFGLLAWSTLLIKLIQIKNGAVYSNQSNYRLHFSKHSGKKSCSAVDCCWQLLQFFFAPVYKGTQYFLIIILGNAAVQVWCGCSAANGAVGNRCYHEAQTSTVILLYQVAISFQWLLIIEPTTVRHPCRSHSTRLLYLHYGVLGYVTFLTIFFYCPKS